MSKIKFRAWDKELKKFVNDFWIDGSCKLHYSKEVSDLVLMQYTGLKDVNDMDIYEGDIVETGKETKGYPEGSKFEVAFIDGQFLIGMTPLYWDTSKNNIKVIGNIYENPDLVACQRKDLNETEVEKRVDSQGTIRYYKRGTRILHRDDGPAVILVDGTKKWYRNNLLHRDDGPAVILADGTKKWYRNNLLHRDDGPAIVWSDGTEKWYRNNLLHRDDGPAIKCADGTKCWLHKGRYHREGGPAIIKADGTELCYDELKNGLI